MLNHRTLCYVFGLGPSQPKTTLTLSITFSAVCHHIFSGFTYIFSLIVLAPFVLARPAAALPPDAKTVLAQPPAPSALNPDQKVNVTRSDAPPPGYWNITALTQTVDGPWRKLRGHAELESTNMLFRADEIDYNDDSGDIEARGNVYFRNFERGEEIWADKLDYNVEDEKGKFYNVHGTGKARIVARPGVLTTDNPFYFQGDWAERLGSKYVLHDGFITNCKMPDPWWRLTGPKFDIVPGERAIAYHSVFHIRNFPLFYAPFFYKSLQKMPRRSGFLMPNLGNSSQRGKMFGIGYFWAINRSYDVTYRVQDFTARGLAHNVDFRAKPREGTDFDAIIYGVQDRGLEVKGSPNRLKQGGVTAMVNGKSDLGDGWYGRVAINYLSSLAFRQAFTESFNEAIFSESNSTAFVGKDWSTFFFRTVFDRSENFQSALPGDSITVRKLPEVDFSSRDRQILKDIPLWYSFDSSAGLLQRTQPLFQTRQFVPRLDFDPRVMTVLRWKDISLVPSFSIRETRYGESQYQGNIVSQNLTRSSREFSADLILPTLERTFNRKTFLGDKLKHVIEPRASFDYVTGVDNFDRVIRFDDTDLLSDTNQVEISLTNRLFAKKDGAVNEVMSWQLMQQRYFDPTFGGAIMNGVRNVLLSTADLTPYTFLTGPRHESPVVSILRVNPKPGIGIEWRTDYDPVVGDIVNSGFTADVRLSNYFISAGHNQVRCTALVLGADCNDTATARLSPPANQFRGLVGIGNENHRGWNAAFTAVYDYRIGVMQFATTQITYNTDCCGFSIQFRRFSFGTRNENQFRLAFNIANIGSFGTLKTQERLF